MWEAGGRRDQGRSMLAHRFASIKVHIQGLRMDFLLDGPSRLRSEGLEIDGSCIIVHGKHVEISFLPNDTNGDTMQIFTHSSPARDSHSKHSSSPNPDKPSDR